MALRFWRSINDFILVISSHYIFKFLHDNSSFPSSFKLMNHKHFSILFDLVYKNLNFNLFLFLWKLIFFLSILFNNRTRSNRWLCASSIFFNFSLFCLLQNLAIMILETQINFWNFKYPFSSNALTIIHTSNFDRRNVLKIFNVFSFLFFSFRYNFAQHVSMCTNLEMFGFWRPSKVKFRSS